MPAPYATHRAQIKAILPAWGMPEENAEPTADILVLGRSARRGQPRHVDAAGL